MVLSRILCDVCEGTGRERLEGERTMICHNGCDNGTFPATTKDLDGQHASYEGLTGVLFVWHDVLCLETEDGVIVVNLKVEDIS